MANFSTTGSGGATTSGFSSTTGSFGAVELEATGTGFGDVEPLASRSSKLFNKRSQLVIVLVSESSTPQIIFATTW